MFFKNYTACEIVFNSVDFFKRELTYGKIYTAYEMNNEDYYFMNDLGYFAGYSNHLFLTLNEWREKQIEKIII